MTKLLVLIDAGHGLSTPGKRAPDDSMREFHFNSATAEKLAKKLDEYKDVVVEFVYDRSGKTDTPLAARTNIANSLYKKYKSLGYKAIYVSIHANASGSVWSDARGIETFIYTTKSAEAVALASKIQATMIKTIGLRDRGVKTADFHVLRETDMAAILVECGFMTNREELALLKADSYREKCADAIIAGLVSQYNIKRKSAPNPVTSAPSIPSDNKIFRVQVGAFKNRESAEAMVRKLKLHGIDAIIV